MGIEVRGQCSVYRTTALAASGIIHAGRAGLFFRIVGFQNNAAVRYLQVFYGSATVPADAVVPQWSVRVLATSPFDLDLGEIGDQYTTGLTWAISSTPDTKTVAAADAWVQALYIPRRD